MSFDEGKHPRVPAGSPKGGEFASKGGGFVAGSSGYEIGSRGYKGNRELSDASIDPEDKLKATTQSYLGKALGVKDLARIAGAPPGSRITECMTDYLDPDRIRVSSELLDKGGKVIGRQFRIINLKDKYIRNESQDIDKSVQGQGIGTKNLLLQSRAAADAGFNFILTKAAGYGNGGKWPTDTNGYYTWARLGFIPAGNDGTVGARGKSGINLTKLMASPEGRAWWKKWGTSFTGRFDLREGSISRRVLEGYAKERGL